MTNTIDRHIGQRLRQRRQQLDLDAASLARRLGMTEAALYSMEAGETRIAAGLLFDLAAALDVPPRYFFEGPHEAGLAAAFRQMLGDKEPERH